eukprot:2881740-Pleurochrysis_carterae.AAC.1
MSRSSIDRASPFSRQNRARTLGPSCMWSPISATVQLAPAKESGKRISGSSAWEASSIRMCVKW